MMNVLVFFGIAATLFGLFALFIFSVRAVEHFWDSRYQVRRVDANSIVTPPGEVLGVWSQMTRTHGLEDSCDQLGHWALIRQNNEIECWHRFVGCAWELIPRDGVYVIQTETASKCVIGWKGLPGEIEAQYCRALVDDFRGYAPIEVVT